MIYFAATPTGSIKIGCTGDIDDRASTLRSYYGVDLELLATMEGDREMERSVHERFGHLRLGRTEQFRPGPDLMAFIGKPLLVGINPEAVEDLKPDKGSLVRLQLPPSEHKEFRKLAAAEETSMAILARRIVLEYIERKRKDGGK